MPQQGVTPRADLKLAPASQHRPHAAIAATAILRQMGRRHLRSVLRAHRREAVPVVRPLASRNVVTPLESVLAVLAVPVVRPEPSRNVLVPLLSVVTVPVMRPLASRKVDCFACTGRPAARMAARARMILCVAILIAAGAGAPSQGAPSHSAHTARNIHRAARPRASA